MDTIDEAAAFLRGAGLSYARRQVQAKRLPTALVEDVVQEALVAVIRAVESGDGPDGGIDNVEAWVTRVVRNIVVDLMRGEMRRAEVLVRGGDDDVDLVATAVDERVDVPAEVVGGHLADDLRAAIARRLDGAALAAAGALAVLAHRDPLDPADIADDCPQPLGGATEAEAASWVGLFYAGRRGWFEDDQGDDGSTGTGPTAAPAAIRQRRSRWARAQADVLAEAADELGLHPGGDHGRT